MTLLNTCKALLIFGESLPRNNVRWVLFLALKGRNVPQIEVYFHRPEDTLRLRTVQDGGPPRGTTHFSGGLNLLQ